MKSRALLALCTAHFLGDSYATFLAPLLPLLMARHHLGLSQAGGLAAVLSLSTHLTQPLWGHVADRRPGRLFAVCGPLVAALSISGIGLATNVFLLTLALAVGGLGMAAFHPQAASLSRASSGERQAFGMSLFISAGNLGFALGPIFVTSLVAAFGLPGTAWALVPGILGFFFLVWVVPRPEGRSKPPSTSFGTDGRMPWAPLLNCFSIATLRALVSVGFLNFLPILFAGRGFTLGEGGALVTLFLLAGAAGGVLGGYAAERFGTKRVMASTLLLSTPFLALAARMSGPLQVLGLVLGGALLVASHPVNINLAQSFAPRRAGTVAAFMIGFAVGLAGLTMPVLGALADAHGIETVLGALALAPLGAFLLVGFIPVPAEAGEASPAVLQEVLD